jgi:L-seryl-tRNA(Ser) seleniumtransferase
MRHIPTLAMLTSPIATVRMRADQVRERLYVGGLPCDVVETEASVGGGAFPTARIRSFAVALSGQADEIERQLRVGTHAVIGRIGNGRLMLDLRSVPEASDDQLVRAVMASLSSPA